MTRFPRVLAAVLVVVTVAAGLGGRAVLPGTAAEPVAGPLGDVFYAALLVWVVVLVVPRTTPAVASALALAACTAIELAHLTDLPAQVLDRWPDARYALGTGFGTADLLWYAVGAALAGGLLALLRPRAARVDEALRHVRERSGRRGGRWLAAVVVPLALIGTIAVAGLGVERTLQSEADDLTAQVEAGRSELDASADKVDDDTTRTTLGDAIEDAGTVLQGTPVLERGPGDAVVAGRRIDDAVDEVRASRRALATAQVTEVRTTLDPARERAGALLTVTDALAADGQDAGASRATVRDALAAVDDTLAATTPEELDALPLADLEATPEQVTALRDQVDGATTDLMMAQDATSCPEADQLWFPQGGKLDADELAPIPWAPEHSIRADLLDGLVAMDEAYRAEFGEHLDINSGYRSYDQQLAVYNPQNPNPLAAPPGCSNHGLGTAVDISVGPGSFDGAPFAWLTRHAGEFGWRHPGWAGPSGRLPEPWHWESVETPQGY